MHRLIETCMLSKYTYLIENAVTHRHTRKHEIHMQMHVAAQSASLCAPINIKHKHMRINKRKNEFAHTHNNTNKNTKTRTSTITCISICDRSKGAHMGTHGLVWCIGIVWCGGRRKLGVGVHERSRGGICGDAWRRRETEAKKAAPPTGPKRKQKQHGYCKKNARYPRNILSSIKGKVSKAKSDKNPRQHDRNNAARNTATKRQEQRTTFQP